MSIPPTLERLSHDAVKRMLDEHARFLQTAGEEGDRLDLSLYEIDDFVFDRLDLVEVRFQSTILLRCRFIEANLTGADLDRTMAPRADFTRANLTRVQGFNAELPGAVFDGADLREAIFIDADLSCASFRGTLVKGARFAKCNLEKAVFERTDLSTAVLD